MNIYFNKKTLIIVLISLGFVESTLAKGWGSSGGGGGVVCFLSQNEAIEADAYINAGQALPKVLLNKIESVVTLDYWDWQKTDGGTLLDFKSKDYKGIVTEVESHVSFSAPLFIYRLKQAGDIIRFNSWQNVQDIPRVMDATPKGELPANCRLVQLVRRLSNNNNLLGQGPVSKIPEVQVEFNSELFDLLNPLNQAILVMHERVYFLAQSNGIDSSDLIRPFVMMFFQQELMAGKIDKDRPYISPNNRRDIRYSLVNLFGDYIIYFGDDIKVTGAIGTQESRFNSFYQLNRNLRGLVAKCSAPKSIMIVRTKEETIKIDMACKDEVMHASINAQYDIETAFVFLTYYVYDIALQQINSEPILVPLKEPVFLQLADKTLTSLCNQIRDDQHRFRMENMAHQAKAYCDQIRH